MNYDLILRTNDNRTKYEYFDIYNYRDSKMVVGGIPINQRLKQQANKQKGQYGRLHTI